MLGSANANQLNQIAGEDVTQEWLDELNEAGFEVTGTGGLKIRDPWLFSQLVAAIPTS